MPRIIKDMFEQWWFKSIGSAKRVCGFFPCLLDYGRFGRKEAIEFFFCNKSTSVEEVVDSIVWMFFE